MTSTFLATLGTAPYLGRTFTTAEHDTASDSVVISYEAWQRRFGRDVDTMRTMMARTVANKHYRATLSSMFGDAALVLAAIGLFGLLTRAVNERRREIGVRMAVGARPGDVVRLVMR